MRPAARPLSFCPVTSATAASIFRAASASPSVSSIIAPAGLEVSSAALHFDIPVMIAVAVACLPIFFTGNQISRLEGGMFLFYYAAYTSLLILAETHPEKGTYLASILGYVLIPLTLVTILGSVIWSWNLALRNRSANYAKTLDPSD